MTDLHAAYRELLVSPATLAQCARAASVAELLALLKRCLHRESASDAAVIAELNALNREVLDLDPSSLAACWLPIRYHAESRAVSWCLPQGRATTPFFDQYIERCRGQLAVNQLLQPKTALGRLLDETDGSDSSAPAGFIFHVSRCGSTLVSGCLAELEHVAVFSEPPLLTEALLDSRLVGGLRRRLLHALMRLQNRRQLESKAAVIKWNAWDLFNWPLIRALYPRTPVLLLVRDPVEVLASHRRLAGRHMAGDPALAGLNPIFSVTNSAESPLDFRIGVLHALLEVMDTIRAEPGVMTVDHARLDAETMRAIGRHFGLGMSNDDYARIRRRLRFHSKEPSREFRPDGREKRRQFDEHERDQIYRRLAPLYARLAAFASPRLDGAVAC